MTCKAGWWQLILLLLVTSRQLSHWVLLGALVAEQDRAGTCILSVTGAVDG